MIIIIIIIILKTLLVMFAFLIMPKYLMSCEIVKKKVKRKDYFQILMTRGKEQ